MMAALRSGNDQARRFLALETATAGWKSRRRYRTATSALFNPGRTPITIDTFNFTRYGLLRGQLLTLSQDMVMHDLQFRSEHFRSVPKTCRAAGHRLNLPEAGAELSGGSIFRWCVSLNFSKAGPTTVEGTRKQTLQRARPKPQSYEGSNHLTTNPAIMALASNPKAHASIVLAIALLRAVADLLYCHHAQRTPRPEAPRCRNRQGREGDADRNSRKN
jgi:hypothetical protein